MRGLPPIRSASRVRRWDAVILGSALPGLVAAIRLGMRGLRVLILEEDAAAARFPGLREPFLMTGTGSNGVLGSCLKALGIPLIDRRRIRAEFPTYQVALPRARVDVGDAEWTVEELDAWQLAPEAAARELVASLRRGAEDQQRALLGSDARASARRLPRLAKVVAMSAARGEARAHAGSDAADPLERASGGAGPLAAFCAAQLRALSDFAETPPPAPIRTHLLGGALGGAAEIEGSPRWLRELFEQRIRSLYGEFRELRGAFRLVSAGNQPAVQLERAPEVCAGRALLVNAPLPALRDAIREGPLPELLKGPDASHRRVSVHWRGPRRALPDAMAARVIRVGDPAQPIAGTNLIRLRVLGNAGDAAAVDLIASAVVSIDACAEAATDAIESGVASLLPLGREGWLRVEGPTPRWDRDELLADPPAPTAWPGEPSL
ncbi:MAG TPA: hypothetical protein VEC18_00575, partial [Myxococcota bacterium]|nr:hypothetical protein [Myxococcota bacterium]